jgi:hypothetical protein
MIERDYRVLARAREILVDEGVHIWTASLSEWAEAIEEAEYEEECGREFPDPEGE